MAPVTVIVVGAGIVGCAIAHELAARDVEVHVIDGRRPGDGATQASAGTLAPYIEGQNAVQRALGASSLDLFDAFLSRVESDSGLVVEYDRSGSLQVARDEREAEELTRRARTLEAEGVRCELLDAARTAALEPGLGAVWCGLLLPQHGFVAALNLTRALARAACRRGARWTRAAVTGLTPRAQGVDVATTDGAFRAEAVVVAAGTWSGAIATRPTLGGEDTRIGHMPPLEPVRGQLAQVHMDRRLVSRVIWGTACYLVPWRDGTVLVGATVERVGFDESTTAQGIATLMESAVDLVPALRGAPVEEARAGLRPRTADELPVVGRSSTMPSVFFAAGHYRSGVLLAPLTAVLVADLILDGIERPELNSLRPDRLGL